MQIIMLAIDDMSILSVFARMYSNVSCSAVMLLDAAAEQNHLQVFFTHAAQYDDIQQAASSELFALILSSSLHPPDPYKIPQCT